MTIGGSDDEASLASAAVAPLLQLCRKLGRGQRLPFFVEEDADRRALRSRMRLPQSRPTLAAMALGTAAAVGGAVYVAARRRLVVKETDG